MKYAQSWYPHCHDTQYFSYESISHMPADTIYISTSAPCKPFSREDLLKPIDLLLLSSLNREITAAKKAGKHLRFSYNIDRHAACRTESELYSYALTVVNSISALGIGLDLAVNSHASLESDLVQNILELSGKLLHPKTLSLSIGKGDTTPSVLIEKHLSFFSYIALLNIDMASIGSSESMVKLSNSAIAFSRLLFGPSPPNSSVEASECISSYEALADSFEGCSKKRS